MLQIQLLGTGDIMYNLWREYIEEYLSSSPTEIEFEEISDIDKILSYNVGSIPALIVNGNVILEGKSIKNPEMDVKKEIFHLLLKQQT